MNTKWDCHHLDFTSEENPGDGSWASRNPMCAVAAAVLALRRQRNATRVGDQRGFESRKLLELRARERPSARGCARPMRSGVRGACPGHYSSSTSMPAPAARLRALAGDAERPAGADPPPPRSDSWGARSWPLFCGSTASVKAAPLGDAMTGLRAHIDLHKGQAPVAKPRKGRALPGLCAEQFCE